MLRLGKLHLVCAAAAAVLALGCEEDCPGVAQSCDSGCYPMRAFPFDAEHRCVTYTPQVVGCTAADEATEDAPCVRRLTDGALFIATEGSAFRDSEDWVECTDTDRAALNERECAFD